MKNLASLDKLTLKNLRFSVHLGCTPEEQALPQDILVTIVLFLDTREAAEADDLSRTVNYSALNRAITAHLVPSRYHLIEAMGAQLARLCLDFSPLIQGVTVKILKPAGIKNGDGAELEITRCRDNI